MIPVDNREGVIIMGTKKAVSLVELIIALSMVTVLVLAIGTVSNSLFAMKRDIIDKQQPAIQGNLAIASIFERVLRGSEGAGSILNISPDGTSVSYSRFGIQEVIWLDAHDPNNKLIKIKQTGAAGQVKESAILTDVASLKFDRDDRYPVPAAGSGVDPQNNRLNVEIALNSGETFRTCVQPRNEYTVIGVID